MAQSIEANVALKKEAVAKRLDRRVVDMLVSTTGAVLAVAMIALGGAAIFGGSFAMDNVKDRLVPQQITFPPLEAMSPEEKAEVGEFAGAKVDTGIEAEAYSRYIGGHLAGINEGKTYSQTSTEARAMADDDPRKAEWDGKVQTLFRGETLRAILLNAYGWYTVGQIALFAGIGMVVAGLFLAVLAFLGFRHARKVS